MSKTTTTTIRTTTTSSSKLLTVNVKAVKEAISNYSSLYGCISISKFGNIIPTKREDSILQSKDSMSFSDGGM
jgi:hypothetical protein